MGIYTCEGKGLEIVVGSRYLVRLRLLKLRRWLDLDLTLGEYLLTELGGEVVHIGSIACVFVNVGISSQIKIMRLRLQLLLLEVAPS